MSYSLKVRPLAAIEIVEAYDWYETQKTGLGLDFLSDLESFYDILLRNPFTYSYYDEPIREGRLKRFPYLVVYDVAEPAEIIILSVFMAKQNPLQKQTF